MRERIAVALNNKLVGISRHWLPEVLCRLAFWVKQSPWEGVLGSAEQNSDSSWATLAKLLGLSEPQIPHL